MKKLLIAMVLFGFGCEKAPVTMDQLKVPQGFRYDMSQKVTTKIQVLNEQGQPVANQTVKAYAPAKDGKLVAEHLFFVGKTDASGQVTTPLRIPAYWKSVVLTANGTTLQSVPINSGEIAAQLALN